MKAASVAKAANGRWAPIPKKTKPEIAFTDYVDWYDVHVSVNKPGHDREQQWFSLFRAFFGTTKDGDINRPTRLSEISRAIG